MLKRIGKKIENRKHYYLFILPYSACVVCTHESSNTTRLMAQPHVTNKLDFLVIFVFIFFLCFSLFRHSSVREFRHRRKLFSFHFLAPQRGYFSRANPLHRGIEINNIPEERGMKLFWDYFLFFPPVMLQHTITFQLLRPTPYYWRGSSSQVSQAEGSKDKQS